VNITEKGPTVKKFPCRRQEDRERLRKPQSLFSIGTEVVINWPQRRHATAKRRSRNPVSKKDIELAEVFCISIRNKGQSFPVRAEHGERIESLMKADPLKTSPILIDQIEIEFPALRLMEVGGEDDLFSIGMKERAEV